MRASGVGSPSISHPGQLLPPHPSRYAPGDTLPMPCPSPSQCGTRRRWRQKKRCKGMRGVGGWQEVKAKNQVLCQRSCALCVLGAPDTVAGPGRVPVLHAGGCRLDTWHAQLKKNLSNVVGKESQDLCQRSWRAEDNPNRPSWAIELDPQTDSVSEASYIQRIISPPQGVVQKTFCRLNITSSDA